MPITKGNLIYKIVKMAENASCMESNQNRKYYEFIRRPIYINKLRLRIVKEKGFYLLQVCEDINECANNNGGCSIYSNCINAKVSNHCRRIMITMATASYDDDNE